MSEGGRERERHQTKAKRDYKSKLKTKTIRQAALREFKAKHKKKRLCLMSYALKA